MVPSLWLKVDKNWAIGKQPWKDSLKTMSWQGLKQEDGLISFRAVKQQSSLMMRLRQAELMIPIWGSKGGEIRQNDNLVQILAQKHNPIKEPSRRRIDGRYEITSRCIAFESPVASSYTQSNNITSEKENPITTSIQPFYCKQQSVN
jgi:hypothetical protein